MATWTKGRGADPVGDVSLADIDTWYSSKDRTIPSGWDDAQGYVMQHIAQGIPSGHTVKHKIKDSKFWLQISGPTINKIWH